MSIFNGEFTSVFSHSQQYLPPNRFKIQNIKLRRRMEARWRKTVIKLEESGLYIHYSKMKSYTKFGFQAIFRNDQTQLYYDVTAFSRSLLQLNNLVTQLEEMIKIYKSLNSKIVAPIVQIVGEKDMFYVISEAFQYTLGDLVNKREGLTEFQCIYFVVDLMEIMNYLKNRQCIIQKLELDDIYLNKNLKPTITFSIFFNELSKKPIMKRLPFRHQYRNRNNCPDLFLRSELDVSLADDVNSWNIGIILYQLLCNKKPFDSMCDVDFLVSKEKNGRINQKLYKLEFGKQGDISIEAKDLIKQLLQIYPTDRLKFSLIIIHSCLKKYSSLPHILPITIFSCPPSETYKQQYFKKFAPEEPLSVDTPLTVSKIMKDNSIRSYMHIEDSDVQNDSDKDKIYFKTQKDLKSSERTLSENKVFIQQFVDISHMYGYGYQMNTGTVCFVFNDQTQYYFPNANTKMIIYKNSKKQEIQINYENFPQEDEIKKKIFILQAFAKTLKRYKAQNNLNQKIITVQGYSKTKHASIFYLTNQSIQVFFTDKINFLMSKNCIYIQQKNSDKYEKFEQNGNPQMQTRKEYCFAMAKKIFQWQFENSCELNYEMQTDRTNQVQSQQMSINTQHIVE